MAVDLPVNQRHVTSPFSRCFADSRDYGGVLDEVRTQSPFALDFAEESHGVQIGLRLIRHVRHCSL
jgi:hypothetical protein